MKEEISGIWEGIPNKIIKLWSGVFWSDLNLKRL